MKSLIVIGSIVVAFFLTSIATIAGDLSNDQKAAWRAVERQWDAYTKKDPNWSKDLLVDEFAGWSNDGPMPRSKASETSWSRLNAKYATTLKYELYPVKVVVHGDMAVAHYYYQSVTEDKESKRKSESGRWTDILVRDGKAWKFIAWQGGADTK